MQDKAKKLTVTEPISGTGPAKAGVMDLSVAHAKIAKLKANLERVLRGKTEAVELSISALLSGGHLLIEDIPGVGKTTLAHSLAKSIDASFQRIQFTSDLLPSDVIGVTVYNQSTNDFEFRRGPLFANVVLADEINRATPKTQSALLEGMNEGRVSVDNATHELPDPFFLIATENPVEYEGTFPLPESQLDRFVMSIRLGYPAAEVEREIISSTPGELTADALSPVLGSAEVKELKAMTRSIRVDTDLADYIVKIARATREHKSVRLGVSPRGTMCLYNVSQALALVSGRNFVTPDDIKRAAVPVLAHRTISEWPGEAGSAGAGGEGLTPKEIINEILSTINVPI